MSEAVGRYQYLMQYPAMHVHMVGQVLPADEFEPSGFGEQGPLPRDVLNVPAA